MALPAALPGNALRLARTAAGRRVLYVALLAGGLFVLGFLCGGRAQAAEGGATTTPATTVAASATSAPATSAGEGTPSGRPVPADRARESAKPFTDQLVPSVQGTVGRVVRPVVDTVTTVTDTVTTVTETVTDGLSEGKLTLPPLESLPILSGLPGLSDLPSLPGAPDDPSLPGLPAGTTPPGDTALPVPPGQASPEPAAGTTEVRQPEHTAVSAARHEDAERTAGKRATTTAPLVYGPRPTAADRTVAAGAARGAVGKGRHAGHVPPRQAPTGDPDGMAGNRSALGDGTTRHLDAQAVTCNHRAPLRLVPGATARSDASGTRDRHRDIPVFPG